MIASEFDDAVSDRLGYLPSVNKAAKPALRWRRRLVDGGLILLLLAIITTVTSVYVSRERVFYYYDIGGYHDTAGGLAMLYQQSPAAAFKAVAESLVLEYNALFAVPLLPMMASFGETRLVYILLLALVYLFPFIVVLGRIGSRLFPEVPRTAFWAAVAVALLTPAFWTPTLRGYPDTGAALLIALAVLVCLREPFLRRWWQIPSIGFLLAAAMIFRRHFAYAALAFLLALAMLMFARFLLQARRTRGAAIRDLLAGAVRVGLTAIASLLTLVACNPAFIKRALTTNYYDLHESYMWSPGGMARWAASGYGWLVWLGAVAGFLLAMRARTIATPQARFVALFGGFSTLIWLLVVRQTDPHYTLHFTPFVVLGLVALGLTAWDKLRDRARAPLLGGLAGLLVANLLIGLGAVPPVDSGPLPMLFASPAPPLTREDYGEVERLITYLREVAPNGAPIYVAASSGTLNNDLLVHAERTLYGRKGARLAILPSPEVDSRDYFPLVPLMRARYVVVVSPFQHHLPPAEQDVVKVVFDIFNNNQEFARDFTRLPARFTLANGAVATVYQRAQPTSRPTAMHALRVMKRSIGERPGGQPDWLVLDQDGPVTVERHENQQYTLTARPGRRDAMPPTTLLHLETWPRPLVIAGQVAFRDQGCPGAILRFSRLDADGRKIATIEVPMRPGSAPQFSVILPRGNGIDLLLEIASVEGASSAIDCTLTLDHLTIRPADDLVTDAPPRRSHVERLNVTRHTSLLSSAVLTSRA